MRYSSARRVWRGWVLGVFAFDTLPDKNMSRERAMRIELCVFHFETT